MADHSTTSWICNALCDEGSHKRTSSVANVSFCFSFLNHFAAYYSSSSSIQVNINLFIYSHRPFCFWKCLIEEVLATVHVQLVLSFLRLEVINNPDPHVMTPWSVCVCTLGIWNTDPDGSMCVEWQSTSSEDFAAPEKASCTSSMWSSLDSFILSLGL